MHKKRALVGFSLVADNAIAASFPAGNSIDERAMQSKWPVQSKGAISLNEADSLHAKVLREESQVGPAPSLNVSFHEELSSRLQGIA